MAGIDPKIIGSTFAKLENLTNELVKQQDNLKVVASGLAGIVGVITGDDVKAIIDNKAKEVKSSQSQGTGLIAGIKKIGLNKSIDKINTIGNDLVREIRSIRFMVAGIAAGKEISNKSIFIAKMDSKFKKLDDMSRKVSGLVGVVERFKAINIKDLISAKFKSKYVEDIVRRFKGLSGEFKKKNELDNMIKLSKHLPDIIANVAKASLAMKALPKNIVDRLEELIIGSKGKKGLVDMSIKMSNNKKQIKEGSSLMKTICGSALFLNITATLLAPTAILAPLAAIGVFFLEKMFFGFGKSGKGGLVKIYKNLSKNKKDIKQGSLLMVAVAASTAASLALTAAGLYAIKKSGATLETMAIAGTSILIEAMVVKTVGKMDKKTLITGTLGVALMGGAFLANSIAMAIMYDVVGTPDWNKFGMVMATVGAESLITYAIGKSIEKMGFKTLGLGALAIGVIGGAFYVNGLAMGKMYDAVGTPDWKKFGMVMATVGGEVAITAALGAIISTGVGALPIFLGALAIGVIGGAFYVNGLAMGKMYDAVGTPDWKKFGFISATVGAEIGLSALAGLFSILSLPGAHVIERVSTSFIEVGNSMKSLYENVGTPDWKKLGFISATVGAEIAISSAAGFVRHIATRGASVIENVAKSFIEIGNSMKTMFETSSQYSNKKDEFEFITYVIKSEMDLCKSAGLLRALKIRNGADTLMKVGIAFTSIGESLSSFLKGLNGINTSKWETIKGVVKDQMSICSISRKESRLLKNGAQSIQSVAMAFSSIGESLSTLFKSISINVSDNDIKNLKKIIGDEIDLSKKAGESPMQTKIGADIIKVIGESLINLAPSINSFTGVKGIDEAKQSIEAILGAFSGEEGKGIFGKRFDEKNAQRKINVLESASRILSPLSEGINAFSKMNSETIRKAANSISEVIEAFGDGKGALGSSVKILTATNFFNSLANPDIASTLKNMSSLEGAAKSINNLDIQKANTLKDILKELNSKEGSREDKLVQICVQLIDALRVNTDAINAYVEASNNGNDEDGEVSAPGFKITNVKDLADELAKKIAGISLDCDSYVDLRINGDGGSEWRITRG